MYNLRRGEASAVRRFSDYRAVYLSVWLSLIRRTADAPLTVYTGSVVHVNPSKRGSDMKQWKAGMSVICIICIICTICMICKASRTE